MAIEAPLSKYKKQNCYIGFAILLAAAVWFGYDGYLNKKFIEKHTVENELGEKVPDGDLEFNRKSPPFFLTGALLVSGYFFMVKNRKVVAGEKSLVTPRAEIPYDSIQKIDKTFFEKKGYFVIIYKEGEKESSLKLKDRSYDNLQAVLDELVKQIS